VNRKHLFAAGAGVLVLIAAGFGVYRLGAEHGTTAPTPANSSASSSATSAPQSIAEGEEATRRHVSAGLKAGDVDPVTGQKILYYHDPMVPANKFDKPGKSPFMDMMLVPVYAGAGSDEGKVTVSPRIQQNLGLRTAEVAEGTLSPQVSTVGSIAFNERDLAIVQARASGYVERLHVRATLDAVRKGQPLVDLYVPEWIAAQEEFLALRRMRTSDNGELADAARQRLRQLGMSEEQIRLVESVGRTQPRITLVAPIGGVAVEIGVREGMTVSPGMTLVKINGLSSVWANAEVPESQAALLRPGAKVQARTPAVPGETFNGQVQAILPEVNATTRTLKARMELSNPGSRLVPGMFVTMDFMDMRPRKSLLVPSEAVIQTGKRTVVMLAEEGGHFRPVDVEAGIESGGQTEIKSGLQAGQKVVISSQFLIDSEASLRGLEARLNNAPPPAPAATQRYEGEGKIESIDREAIMLSHGPIPALKWGPMTMEFKTPPAQQMPRNLAPGDRVTFEFTMDPDGPRITHLSPAPAPAPAQPSASGAQR
jgi:Cu(I)/Ag(I) efflux system membrane fusion protein